MQFTKLKLPNSEVDITSKWIYTDKTYISVICTAYNQEIYIRDAIEGFLAQECEYKFEIIIHDDCSTDNTASIIKEYRDKFPNIIKYVKPESNLYSININRPFKNAVEHSSGEYIAICEGDDFWIDKKKLQKQIIRLKNNKNINFTFSKALGLYPDGKIRKFCDLGSKQKIIPFSKCIIGPKKDYYPTASFFIRGKILNELPEWFYSEAPVGDYYIQFFASSENGAFYIPESMVVYRLMSNGSWSKLRISESRINGCKARLKCNRYLFSKAVRKNIKKSLNRRALRYRKELIMTYFKQKKFDCILIELINLFSNK